jgi:hypothetical protein
MFSGEVLPWAVSERVVWANGKAIPISLIVSALQLSNEKAYFRTG